jgi:hypothetical protein
MRAADQRRADLLEQWLERVLATYPEETARFLRGTGDPFRNPAGRALREGLPQVLDEVLGDMRRERLEPALDGILRLRAVQDLSARDAVSFVFFLRDLLPAAEAARIDEVALLAFEIYMRCREQIWRIKAGEDRRRAFVMERAAQREKSP